MLIDTAIDDRVLQYTCSSCRYCQTYRYGCLPLFLHVSILWHRRKVGNRHSAFSNVVKRSYNTFVLASLQKVSPPKGPELPAPPANLCPDEATTGTSDINRRASFLILRDAFRSRSRDTPHSSQMKTRSESLRCSFTHPQHEQVFDDGYQRSTSWTYPPYCSVL